MEPILIYADPESSEEHAQVDRVAVSVDHGLVQPLRDFPPVAPRDQGVVGPMGARPVGCIWKQAAA